MKYNKVYSNMSWLIIGGIFESIIGFIVATLTVRYLGPSNYGLLNYAVSLASFVTPICTLGFDHVLVNEVINKLDSEGKILGTAIISSLITSLIMIFVLFLFVFIVNKGDVQTIIITLLYNTILIINSLKLIIFWFQAKLLSKYTSIISIIAFLIASIYKVSLLIQNKSIYWFAVVNSLDYLIVVILLFLVYKKRGGKRLEFSLQQFKYMFSRSKYFILSSMMTTIFLNTDQIMVKNLIGNYEGGLYAAAISCCNITYFIYTALINSYRPLIFENKKLNQKDYLKNIEKIYSVVIFLTMVQTVFMLLFSKEIIYILYGGQYNLSANLLFFLAPTVIFNQVGNARSIWILSEHKYKEMTRINMIGAFVNVILNYVLINYLGVNGAAISTLITYFFVNILSNYIIDDFKENGFILKCSIMKCVDNVKEFICDLIKGK